MSVLELEPSLEARTPWKSVRAWTLGAESGEVGADGGEGGVVGGERGELRLPRRLDGLKIGDDAGNGRGDVEAVAAGGRAEVDAYCAHKISLCGDGSRWRAAAHGAGLEASRDARRLVPPPGTLVLKYSKDEA